MMYKMVPGFSSSLLAMIIVSLLTNEFEKVVHHEFDEM